MNGVLSVLKPSGMSSNDVVCTVRRITREKRCGHMGTLDPAAAGVLPIGVGKSVRLFDYLLTKPKRYLARVALGYCTDTLDAYGKITHTGENKEITERQFAAALNAFNGRISQLPPKYSALNVGGKKAYALAVAGQEFDLPAREVEIYSIHSKGMCGRNEFELEVSCSSGTYIRSLARDIALELGTYGSLATLIRLDAAGFNIDGSLTLSELAGAAKCGELSTLLKSASDALNHLPPLSLSPQHALRAKSGLARRLSGIADGLYRVYEGQPGQNAAYEQAAGAREMLIGVGVFSGGELKLKTRLDD